MRHSIAGRKPRAGGRNTNPNAPTPPPRDLLGGVAVAAFGAGGHIFRRPQADPGGGATCRLVWLRPSLRSSLTGSAGTGGRHFSKLFDLSSRTIYGIGTVTQPIFEGGKLRGQLRLSRETKEEMVLSYQKTHRRGVSRRFQCLIAYEKQRVYREEQEKLVAAATRDAVGADTGTKAKNGASGSVDHGLQFVLSATDAGGCAARRSVLLWCSSTARSVAAGRQVRRQFRRGRLALYSARHRYLWQVFH